MQRSLLFKTVMIFFLVLLLTIPLGMIRAVVYERQAYRDAARRDIAVSLADSQKLAGPLLIIPYDETIRVKRENPETKKMEEVPYTERKFIYFLPDTLNVTGSVKTEERYRGIYKVPTYAAALKIAGSFSLPAQFGVKPSGTVAWDEAVLWIALSDNRGIQSQPVLSWQGKAIDFIPGGGDFIPLKVSPNGGISAKLGKMDIAGGSYSFAFDLPLVGTERLDWVPSAKDMSVAISADWPHPSFSGRFLPIGRKINDAGFAARWHVSYLASNAEELFRACTRGSCESMLATAFGVGFIQPVDSYSQATRALKYGLLFIALTFTVFFLFETLKQMPVHPVQYGLVGMALALFFLLLISLSEHIAFAAAYAISASACILLLASYVSAVLRSAKRSIGFSAGLALLYATLYGLLQSEDNALLLGSLLIFGVLAGIMLLTRKVDWYQMGVPAARPAPRNP